MSERYEKVVCFRVSKEEKEFLKQQATKHNLKMSDIIRRRVLRPEITNSEIVNMLMNFIGKKFNEFKFTLPSSQELGIRPTKQQHSKIKISPEKRFMRAVLDELKEKFEEIREKYVGIEN